MTQKIVELLQRRVMSLWLTNHLVSGSLILRISQNILGPLRWHSTRERLTDFHQDIFKSFAYSLALSPLVLKHIKKNNCLCFKH